MTKVKWNWRNIIDYSIEFMRDMGASIDYETDLENGSVRLFFNSGRDHAKWYYKAVSRVAENAVTIYKNCVTIMM